MFIKSKIVYRKTLEIIRYFHILLQLLLCSWTPLGNFHPPDLLARPPTTWTVNPLHCKIMGTPMNGPMYYCDVNVPKGSIPLKGWKTPPFGEPVFDDVVYQMRTLIRGRHWAPAAAVWCSVKWRRTTSSSSSVTPATRMGISSPTPSWTCSVCVTASLFKRIMWGATLQKRTSPSESFCHK